MYDISIGTEVVETWHKYFRELKYDTYKWDYAGITNC